MKSPRTRLALAALLTLAATLPAPAQIRLKDKCKISNPQDIAFGTYVDGQTSPAHSALVIVVTCKGEAINVDAVLTAGPGENSGDMLDRRLRHKHDAAEYLRYQLYVDTARTRVWGDGTRGTEAIVLGNTNRTGHAYAEIPGGQSGIEGEYSDRVVITVLP